MEDGAEMAIQLIVMIVFGIVCATVASGRGRSPVGWFFIGFLFSCLGLIVLLVIPDLKVEAARHERLRGENRKLRERLRKDRQIADARHEESQRRLHVHDKALGMDTAPELANPEVPKERISAAPPPPVPPAADSTATHDFEASEWYYAEGADRLGPVNFGELRRLWREGTVGATTLVWRESMDDWSALGAIPDLEEALRA